MGITLLREGKPEEARLYFKKAYGFFTHMPQEQQDIFIPVYVKTLVRLASKYRDNGDHDSENDCLNEAVKLLPENNELLVK